MKQFILFCLTVFLIFPGLLVYGETQNENFRIGKDYYLSGQFNYAEIFLSKAIEENNSLEEAYFLLGNIYDNQEKFDKAIDMYLIGKDLSEHKTIYWLNLGQAYRHNNDFDRALMAYEQAEKISRNYPQIHLYRGMVFYKMKEREETIQSWEQYLVLAPNNPQYNNITLAVDWLKREDFQWPSDVPGPVVFVNNGHSESSDAIASELSETDSSSSDLTTGELSTGETDPEHPAIPSDPVGLAETLGNPDGSENVTSSDGPFTEVSPDIASNEELEDSMSEYLKKMVISFENVDIDTGEIRVAHPSDLREGDDYQAVER